MRIQILLGLVLGALIVAVVGQDLDLQGSLPSCSLGCFDPEPPQNKSSLACRNKAGHDFEGTFSPCFYSSCTPKLALTALNVTSIICEAPIRDISWAMRIYLICATAVSSLVIGCRVILKYQSLAGEIGWDDWAILVAVIVTLDAAFGQYIAANFGMGRDIWTIPFDNVYKVYKSFFASMVGYKLGNMFVRLSILCFYLRIFGTSTFRTLVMVAIGFNLAIGVTFVLVDMFQCHPVSHFWNEWDGEHKGSCRNLQAIAWAHSIFNIVLDIIALAFAIWMVRKLKMHRRKKFAVMGMFVLGSAITVVTFVRLQALPPLNNNRNRTWSMAPLAYWSAIEMTAGLICVCLPALKKARFIFRGKVSSTYHSDFSDPSKRSNNGEHQNPPLSKKTAPIVIDLDLGETPPSSSGGKNGSDIELVETPKASSSRDSHRFP